RLFSLLPPPPSPTLFPYTTLFRSVSGAGNTVSVPAATDANGQTTATLKSTRAETKTVAASVGATTLDQQPTVTFVPALIIEKIRSEEHTSELQSRFDLVCRLLLEK